MTSPPIVGLLVWQLTIPDVHGSLATACAVEEADGLVTLWIEVRPNMATAAGAYDSGPFDQTSLEREAAQWREEFRGAGWVDVVTPVASLSEA